MPAVAGKPRIEITKSALLAALSGVVPVARQKTTLPILSCLRWSGSMIEATDLDTWVTVALDGLIEDGLPPVCVSAAKFSEVAKQLDADGVTVEWSDTSLTVLNGRDRYRMVGMNAAEFPLIPVVEGEPFALPAAVLAEALSAVRYVIATGNLENSSRPALQGVHLVAGDKQLVAEATDAHRLARIVSPVASSARGDALLPWSLVDRLLPLLIGADEGDVEVCIGDGMVRVSLDGAWSLMGRQVDAEFPPTQWLFKVESKIAPLSLPRLPWMAAVSRARTLSPALNNKIGVSLEDGEATFTTEDDKTGAGIVRAVYTSDLPHEPVEFHVNAAYLREALAHLAGDKVTLLIGKGKNVPLHLTGTRNDTALVVPLQK